MAQISFRLRDYAGRRGTMVAHVQDGAAFVDYDAGATLLQTYLDNVTAAVIESVNLNLPLTLPGTNKPAPVDDMELNRGALFSFDTDGIYNYGLWVPGINDQWVTGQSIITTGANMDEFLDWFINGSGGGAGSLVPHNGHDKDIIALSKAALTFRKA